MHLWLLCLTMFVFPCDLPLFMTGAGWDATWHDRMRQSMQSWGLYKPDEKKIKEEKNRGGDENCSIWQMAGDLRAAKATRRINRLETCSMHPMGILLLLSLTNYPSLRCIGVLSTLGRIIEWIKTKENRAACNFFFRNDLILSMPFFLFAVILKLHLKICCCRTQPRSCINIGSMEDSKDGVTDNWI